MNSYISIIKADYYQRARSYVFLITMLASVCLAYTFVPTADAAYSTVRIGNYVGENNAAWIGHVTAFMASTFLWLIGFYLVHSGIRRDQDTGIGQIVATTSLSNFKYLLAKSLSNFFVLFTITLIVMMMALVLVIVRGHTYHFDIVQFLSPFLFATLPSIFCVSVLAVLAEVLLGKYNVLQYVIFFFLFPAIIAFTTSGQSSNQYWFDVLGTKYLSDSMIGVVNATTGTTFNSVSAGFLFGEKNKIQYFLFQGTHWSTLYIISRIAWVILAVFILFIFSKFFHRFDVKERISGKKENKKVDLNEIQFIPKEIQLSTLPLASPQFGILPFIKIEFLMLIRKGPKWIWLINIGVFVALFFIPLAEAHKIGLPILWFLQINRWADIATKEKENSTHYFTYAAFRPLQRLLFSQIIAGVLLTMLLALPLIFRHAISGNYTYVLSILLGATFVVAFSVSSGIVSGGKRLFEILFFMLTYTNLNFIPEMDYFGALKHGTNYLPIVASIICLMFITAVMFRRYEIRNQ